MDKNSFLGHLEALRRMALEILMIFVLLLIPGWYLAADMLNWLQQMAGRIAAENGMDILELRYIALMEPFLVELKLGMLLAFAAGMPLYFWRFWHFTAPALYRHERRIFLASAAAAWGLFFCGAALALWGVMPLLVKFSLSFAREGLTPQISLDNFIGLMMNLVLAFGLMFELPLLLLALAAAGIVRMETLAKQRPLAAVIILILAAVLTPPDVISQLMLFIPIYLLFELTIWLGRAMIKKTETDNDQSEDPAAETINEESSSNSENDADKYEKSCYFRRKVPRRTRPKKYMPPKLNK